MERGQNMRISPDGSGRPIEMVTVREAVGVFRDPKDLQETIDELQSHGVMRHEISVLAGEEAIRDKLGHSYRRVENAEDDPMAPRTLFVSTEEIREAKAVAVGIPLFVAATATGAAVITAGGTLLEAVLYAGAAGVLGAAAGAMLSMFIAKRRAEYLQEQIRRGGLLLWVHLRSPGMEKTAKKILLKHAARDVHAHDLPVYK
jgi:hypothetical protein